MNTGIPEQDVLYCKSKSSFFTIFVQEGIRLSTDLERPWLNTIYIYNLPYQLVIMVENNIYMSQNHNTH